MREKEQTNGSALSFGRLQDFMKHNESIMSNAYTSISFLHNESFKEKIRFFFSILRLVVVVERCYRFDNVPVHTGMTLNPGHAGKVRICRLAPTQTSTAKRFTASRASQGHGNEENVTVQTSCWIGEQSPWLKARYR